MKSFLKRSSFCLFFLCGLAALANAQKIKRINGSYIQGDSLSAHIVTMMKQARVAGLGIVIYNHNQPVFKHTYGLANVPEHKAFTDTQVLYGASFSKAIFAYIANQLIQEKVLDPDKPLVQYLSKPLPDYKIPGWNRGYQDIREDKRYGQITARMCLSHTTGFPNWRWFEPNKKLKIKFTPGTRYSYSGEGMYLLQFVIEQITGKDYESIARERVFIPLGMNSSSYIWHPEYASNLIVGHNREGIPYEFMHWKEAGCAGTLCTTLNDYSRFFAVLMQPRGLSVKTFNQMIQLQIPVRSVKQFGPLSRKDSTLNDAIGLGYGLGVGVFHTPYGRAFFKEGHDDGWGHYSVAYPDKDIGVVIMTNSDAGESLFKQLLAESIGDTYTPWAWEDYLPFEMPE